MIQVRWKTSLALLLAPVGLATQAGLPAELGYLREPRLATRPAEPMLVVEAQGDPRVVGGAAFGLLFQLYYQVPQTPKGPGQVTLRARWPFSLTRPRSEWIGQYALPVPAGIISLPPFTPPPGLQASLTTWEYGTVVEVLHVGPYEQEGPTLERLRAFADSNGYVPSTEHEEEYLRGPTMTGPGDPAEYLTILRYRVSKKTR